MKTLLREWAVLTPAQLAAVRLTLDREGGRSVTRDKPLPREPRRRGDLSAEELAAARAATMRK